MNVWSKRNEEHFRIDPRLLWPTASTSLPDSLFAWDIFSKTHSNYYYDEGEVKTLETSLTGDEIRAWLPFAGALASLIQEGEYPSVYFSSSIESVLEPFRPTTGLWLLLCTGIAEDDYKDIGEQVRKHYAFVRPSYIETLDLESVHLHYNFFLSSDPVARLAVSQKNKLIALANGTLSLLVGILHTAWLAHRTPAGVEVPWYAIDWANVPSSGYMKALHDSGQKEASSMTVISSLRPGEPIALLEALRGSSQSGSYSLKGSVTNYNYNGLQGRFISFSVDEWGALYTKLVAYLSQWGTKELKRLGLHPIISLPAPGKIGETLSIWDCVAYTTIQCITASASPVTLDPSRVPLAVTRGSKKLGSTVLLSLTEVLIGYISEKGEQASESRPELFADAALKAIESGTVPDEFGSLV